LLLLIGAFFAYHGWNLSSWPQVGASCVFLVLSALAVSGRIFSTRYQTLTINIGISLAFLDQVFAEIAWDAMGQALARANYWLLGPAFVIVVVTLFLRAWRWQWLLRSVGQVPFSHAFRAACLGIGANMVLPARAGEFLRVYALGRTTGHSKTAILATLVIERILDGFTILLLLVGVMLLGARGEQLHYLGMAGGAFYLAALGGLLVFFYRQAWIVAIARRLLPESWAGPATRLLDAFADGLHVLRNGRQLLIVSGQSLLTWVAISVSFYPVMLAFEYGAPVPLFAPFLLTPLLALGLTVPGAPGGIGIMQYMAVLALQLSIGATGAVPASDFAEQAAAFSVLMHLSQAIPEIGFGLWAFATTGLSWREVGSREVGAVT
jgi:uncharacterized protein (TIRG00374 family)